MPEATDVNKKEIEELERKEEVNSVVSELQAEKKEVKPALPTPQPERRGGRPGGRFFKPTTIAEGAEYESRLLDLARVVRVSSGGKRLRFRAVIILGNKNGKIGLGIGKGADVAQAVEKATRAAKKNVLEIPVAADSIPYEVESKFGAAHILLRPQRKGKGLVAGGTVRIICSLAGIKNISSKTLGRTSNKLNNAIATINALKMINLKSRKEHAITPAKN